MFGLRKAIAMIRAGATGEKSHATRLRSWIPMARAIRRRPEIASNGGSYPASTVE